MAVGLTVSGSSLKACRVRVRGRVQRVGYRRFVLELAQELGLVGYVLNERDNSVTLFVQGGAEPLAKFLESIRVPPRGLVREVAVEEAGPVSGLEYFEIKFGSVQEELQEGLGGMEAEFSDYRGEFKDFRSEFRDYRSEFRDFREEFRGFAARTDENFRLMSEKYGEISEKLSLTFEALRAESAETRRMLADAIESLKKESAETRKILTEAIESLKRDSAETREELKRAVDNLARLVEKLIGRL